MSKATGELLHLTEDAATGDRFLIYASEQGPQIEIRCQGEELWMTQAQIGQLFGRDQSVISRHIQNILKDAELDEESIMQKLHIAGSSRPVAFYGLDMVISVGYRVSSVQATLFRRWSTSVLVQFARKAYVVDTRRLRTPDGFDHLTELREIIRDLRSDEANLYRELRRICSMCQDYDGSAVSSREFYQRVQAKLVYAVTSHTPSEIIAGRADAHHPSMGLQSWPGNEIRKQDVTISKNYLAEAEINELNRLTSILLDIFEDQLDVGRLVTMQDAILLLERQLAQLGRAVLGSGGSIRTSEAKLHAERQYTDYSQRRKTERLAQGDQMISELAAAIKLLPKKPPK